MADMVAASDLIDDLTRGVLDNVLEAPRIY